MESNSLPLVTVVMSTFNDEKTIENAINSIVNQTYKNIEFILINDGSRDGTLSVINKFSIDDDRIKVINQENKGLTKSLNIGIKQARGKYIARQDADDISMLTRIEKQVEYLESNSNIVLIGTNRYIINDNIKKIGKYYDDEEINKIVYLKSPFAHTSAMYRKDIFIEIGLYDESYITAQDFEAWMRFASVGKISMIDEPLVESYLSNTSISAIKSNQQCSNAFKTRMKYKNNNLLSIVKHSLYQCIVGNLPNWIFVLKRKLYNEKSTLNGDMNLKKIDKVKYLLVNLITYIFGTVMSFNKKSVFFKEYKNVNNLEASPMREYVDSYLDFYLSKFKNKTNLKILDIGCGSGFVYDRLVKHGFSGEYIGVDIYKNKDFDKNISEDLKKDILLTPLEEYEGKEKFDLIISVTSLEHIESDQLVITKAKELLKDDGKELHIVPAGFSLFLYLLHGWRQYNLFMLHRLFSNRKSFKVVRAGGISSGLFHFMFITIPSKLKFNLIKKLGNRYENIRLVFMKMDKYVSLAPVVYIIEVDENV